MPASRTHAGAPSLMTDARHTQRSPAASAPVGSVFLGALGNARALLRLGAVHGDEGRAKPFDAGEILLQLDWSMVRLRPNSVSSAAPRAVRHHAASPQPSQTSSL